jgi:hypothetical protein
MRDVVRAAVAQVSAATTIATQHDEDPRRREL